MNRDWGKRLTAIAIFQICRGNFSVIYIGVEREACKKRSDRKWAINYELEKRSNQERKEFLETFRTWKVFHKVCSSISISETSEK